MNKSYVPRTLLVLIGFLFMMNHLVLGIFWLPYYDSVAKPILAFAMYFASVVLSIFVGKHTRLPLWIASFNLLVATVVPWLVLSEYPIENYAANGSYATWFIGGIGALMSLTTLRAQPMIGLIGLGIMVLEVLRWGGVGVLATSGLVGATVLVAVGFAIGRGLASTSKLTEDYREQATASATKTAALTAARTERQKFLLSGLEAAMPMLERIVARNGDLDEIDLREARLVQAKLTDEIRGKHLLNPAIQLAARDARIRGVEVTILDEGGLDDLDETERHELLNSVADAIRATQAGKIHIRAPKGEPYRVNIVATRPEASAPDLWLRLS
ncbi:MAG: hypothetical protein ACKORF_02715 [Micrococcales bacterium]